MGRAQNTLDERLLDLLYGDLTPEEAARLRAEVAEHPELVARLQAWEQIRQVAADLSAPPPDPQIHYALLRAARADEPPPRRRFWSLFEGLALAPALAALGLAVLATGAFLLSERDASTGGFTARPEPAASPSTLGPPPAVALPADEAEGADEPEEAEDVAERRAPAPDAPIAEATVAGRAPPEEEKQEAKPQPMMPAPSVAVTASPEPLRGGGLKGGGPATPGVRVGAAPRGAEAENEPAVAVGEAQGLGGLGAGLTEDRFGGGGPAKKSATADFQKRSKLGDDERAGKAKARPVAASPPPPPPRKPAAEPPVAQAPRREVPTTAREADRSLERAEAVDKARREQATGATDTRGADTGASRWAPPPPPAEGVADPFAGEPVPAPEPEPAAAPADSTPRRARASARRPRADAPRAAESMADLDDTPAPSGAGRAAAPPPEEPLTIARAARSRGDHRAAAVAYSRFLSTNPPPDVAAQAALEAAESHVALGQTGQALKWLAYARSRARGAHLHRIEARIAELEERRAPEGRKAAPVKAAPAKAAPPAREAAAEPQDGSTETPKRQ